MSQPSKKPTSLADMAKRMYPRSGGVPVNHVVQHQQAPSKPATPAARVPTKSQQAK